MQYAKSKMTKDEALDQLKFDIDMLLFDPLTGDDIHPSCLNEMNKNAYECDLFCIELLTKYETLEKAFDEACKTNAKLANDIVGLNRSDKSIKHNAQSYKEMLLKKYAKKEG